MGGMWNSRAANRSRANRLKPVRELKEELGITVMLGEELITVDHAYSHKKLRFVVHLCTWEAGIPSPSPASGCWVRPEDLGNYAFPAANARIIEALLGRLASSAHP